LTAFGTAGHASQLPQWPGSKRGSTHVPHAIRGAAQLALHAPLEHAVPAPQICPALPPGIAHPAVAPQCVALVLGSKHAPLHTSWVPGHETWHVPPLQTLPAAHVAPWLPAPHVPLAPQKVRFVEGSTHVPLQLIWPPGQETWQLPPLQTLPAAHVAPGLPPPGPHPVVAPQFVRLVVGSMHVPPQLMRPAWQESAHAPPLQTCPAVHDVPPDPPPTPHAPAAPQCVRSVVGSMHVPPQLMSPGWQETAQPPPLQT
jgi:hypothetical protein